MAERVFLKEARERSGLTMKVLSDMVHISEGAYCNIERGKRTPSVPVAKRIAEALNIDWTLFY